MVSPRVTHNDETPVTAAMNGNQQEVLSEDVHTLCNQMLLATMGGRNLTVGSVAPAEHRQGNNRGNRLLTLVHFLTLRWSLCACVNGLLAPCCPAHAYILVICDHLSVIITHSQQCQLTLLKV